jgi:hypothetical protein
MVRASWSGPQPLGVMLTGVLTEADVCNYLDKHSTKRKIIMLYIPITRLLEYDVYANYGQYVKKRPLIFALINKLDLSMLFSGSVWSTARTPAWSEVEKSPDGITFTPRGLVPYFLAKDYEANRTLLAEALRKIINTVLTALGRAVPDVLPPITTDATKRVKKDPAGVVTPLRTTTVSRLTPDLEVVKFGTDLEFDSGIQTPVPVKARPVKCKETCNNRAFISDKPPAFGLSGKQGLIALKQQNGSINPSIPVVGSTGRPVTGTNLDSLPKKTTRTVARTPCSVCVVKDLMEIFGPTQSIIPILAAFPLASIKKQRAHTK